MKLPFFILSCGVSVVVGSNNTIRGALLNGEQEGPTSLAEGKQELSLLDSANDPTIFIGCFKKVETIETQIYRLNVRDFTVFAKAEVECATDQDLCKGSDFIGVVKGKNPAGKTQFICRCYSNYPDPSDNRLGLGFCSNHKDVPDKDKMQLYFNSKTTNPVCNDERRDQIAKKITGTAHYGFDLLKGAFKQVSLFDLYQTGCDTNMYAVEALYEGFSNSATTTARQVTSYHDDMRTSMKLSFSASAGGGGIFKKIIKVGGSVAASSSSEFSYMFKSSGAQDSSSRMFYAYKEERLASVYINGFQDKTHFVELSEPFLNALKTYKAGNYNMEAAKSIFNNFGHVALTQGVYGGYAIQRATARKSKYSSSLESEMDARLCFAASAEVGFSILDLGGVGASTSSSVCTKEVRDSLREAAGDYSQTSDEFKFYGMDQGTTPPKVTAQSAQLFDSFDLYQGEHSGDLRLQFLFEFVHPTKIHPVTVKKSTLSEADFGVIYEKLRDHTEVILSNANSTLAECLSTCEGGIPYLEEVVGEEPTCNCYGPFTGAGQAKEVCFPPIDDFAYLKWNGLCISMNGQSGTELYSRGCRGGHAQRWKFESNGLLRSHYSQQCVGISTGTDKLITQPCDTSNSEQKWGYDQDGGYLFQLKDRSKCATIVPSEKEHFESSRLQLGNCSFGSGGSKPLCYDGIPLSSSDSEKSYCCRSTCLDATGSPQCGGVGCSSLVGGIYNCCASQLGTKVCTDPGDTGCYTTKDVGFKSFEGAMLQQFVYKKSLT